MFFYISGRAQALSPTIGLRKTVALRCQRLLLPFVVSYLLIIPPWQYIDKEYDWKHPSVFRMKANPIAWLAHYYTSSDYLIYFDLAWLWFLPALFAIGVFSTSLFLVAEGYGIREGKRYWLLAFGSWLAFALWLHFGLGFTLPFAAFAIVGEVFSVLLAVNVRFPPGRLELDRAQVVCHASAVRSWCALRLAAMIQILANIGLVLNFEYAVIDPHRQDGGHDPRAAIPFLVLCTGFYVQGYFTQRWADSALLLTRGTICEVPAWVHLFKLVMSFILLIVITVAHPMNDVEDGHLIYPIYSASYPLGRSFGAAYVIGTWAYIMIFVTMFEAHGNHIINAWFYKHATRSTIVVYIVHWAFIKVFAFWCFLPTMHRWYPGLEALAPKVHFALAITILCFLGAVGFSLLVYLILLRLQSIGKMFGV